MFARLPAVVMLGAFVCLSAACTRVGTASGDAAGGRPSAWTKPGILRIVDLQEPDRLNPLLGNAQLDSDLANFWGGMLLNWSDTNEFVPELATEVPTLENGGISKDNRTVTYHLRPGVLWHDGKPFTADDVIFTWHAVLNKKNNVGSTVGYDIVASIDKRDDHTIVVHLKYAWAPFIASFFAPSGTPYPVLPAHLLAQYDNINRVAYNSQPIGTGPFTVERWQRGSKIVFRANPHYWRGAPKLKEIWYSPIPNENTVITLLQAHEADLEYNGSPTHVASIPYDPGLYDDADRFHAIFDVGPQRAYVRTERFAGTPSALVRPRRCVGSARCHARRRRRGTDRSACLSLGAQRKREALYV